MGNTITLAEILVNAIYNHITKNDIPPEKIKGIIMHPRTCHVIFEENNCINSYYIESEPKFFRDIKIYRTQDMIEGVFEIF